MAGLDSLCLGKPEISLRETEISIRQAKGTEFSLSEKPWLAWILFAWGSLKWSCPRWFTTVPATTYIGFLRSEVLRRWWVTFGWRKRLRCNGVLAIAIIDPKLEQSLGTCFCWWTCASLRTQRLSLEHGRRGLRLQMRTRCAFNSLMLAAHTHCTKAIVRDDFAVDKSIERTRLSVHLW